MSSPRADAARADAAAAGAAPPARAAEAVDALRAALNAVQAGRADGTTAPPVDSGAANAHAGAEPGAMPKHVKKALAYILRSTQARPQTEAEVAAKLRGREIPDNVADAALTQARKLRAVDDAAFARAWVEDRGRQRGFGAARLRQELRRRQVPDELIDDALGALEDRDDFSAAAELARARLRQLPAKLDPAALARRLTSYLVRRGYPPALSQRVAITVSGLDRRWD